MAGGERIELPPKESKSFELTVIRTPYIGPDKGLAGPGIGFNVSVPTLARHAGLEPATHGLEDRCAIQLRQWRLLCNIVDRNYVA